MRYWIKTSILVVLITFVVSSLVQYIPTLIMTALGTSHLFGFVFGVFRLPLGLYAAYRLVLRKRPSNENDLIAYRSIKQFMIIIGIASIIAEIWFIGSNFWIPLIPESYFHAATFGVVSVPSFAWLVGLVVARYVITRERLVDPKGTRTHYWVSRAYQTALFLAIAWPALSLLSVIFGILLPFPFSYVGSLVIPIVVIVAIIIHQIKKLRNGK